MKKTQNVISRELQGFERSYLETKIGTPDTTLTGSHCRNEKFKF